MPKICEYAAQLAVWALLASPLVAEARAVGLGQSALGHSLGVMALVALCIFGLLLCEFALVGLTSSLSLSIFGVLKELCAIVLAAVFLGDRLSRLATAGLAVCIAGILVYHSAKAQEQARGLEQMVAESRSKAASVAAGAAPNDPDEGPNSGRGSDEDPNSPNPNAAIPPSNASPSQASLSGGKSQHSC